MRFCGNLAALLVLLSWLSLSDSAAPGKGRKGKIDDLDNGVAFKGKFTGRGGEKCRWTVSGEKRYTLHVSCVGMKKRKHASGYSCEYTADPALCPGFVKRPKAFWRQISSELRIQKRNVCRNAHKTVQANMCQNAPAEAHFRLVNPLKVITKSPMTTPAGRAGLPEDMSTTECTRRADHLQLAQEKCGDAWASFCNFLFIAVQSRDC